MQLPRLIASRRRAEPITWDFRSRTAFWTMVVGAMTLAPFMLRYLLLGYPARALGNAVIVGSAVFLAWTAREGRFQSAVAGAVIIPGAASFICWVVAAQGLETAFWFFPLIAANFLTLPAVWSWIDSAFIVATGVPATWMAVGASAGLRLGVGLVLVALFSGIAIHLIDSQQAQLERQAVTDPMTGLMNRVRLRGVLEDAVTLRVNERRSAVLVSVDIDHFKAINDTYGHLVGDDVIRQVAQILRDELPSGATVFRMGGEEFLAVLPGIGEDGGLEVARVLVGVVASRLGDRPVTVSAGVAGLRLTDGPDEWLHRGDEALYRAKESGRNRAAV